MKTNLEENSESWTDARIAGLSSAVVSIGGCDYVIRISGASANARDDGIVGYVEVNLLDAPSYLG